MNIEKGKLKNALSEYQQAKRDEAERIERVRQEEQRRSEIVRAEREILMYKTKKFLAEFAVFVGIIAGIYFGWIYILDFVLRFIASYLTVGILYLIFVIFIVGFVKNSQKLSLSDNFISRLILVLALIFMVMTYIPSSDFYTPVPIWSREKGINIEH